MQNYSGYKLHKFRARLQPYLRSRETPYISTFLHTKTSVKHLLASYPSSRRRLPRTISANSAPYGQYYENKVLIYVLLLLLLLEESSIVVW
jgi:hypothetical protein